MASLSWELCVVGTCSSFKELNIHHHTSVQGRGDAIGRREPVMPGHCWRCELPSGEPLLHRPPRQALVIDTAESGPPICQTAFGCILTRLWVQRQRPLAFLGSFSPSPSLRECLSPWLMGFKRTLGCLLDRQESPVLIYKAGVVVLFVRCEGKGHLQLLFPRYVAE